MAGLPANAVVDTVVTYAPDPRGHWLFAALTGRARRDLNRYDRAVVDARTSSYGGWAASPQRFTGLAGLAAGRQRAIASTTSQLVNERSTLTDNPGLRAFYEQMKRQQA